MKKVIELNLQVDIDKISGRSDSEIKKFIEDEVNPFLVTCFTERSRGTESGGSYGSGNIGGICGSIRF